MKGKGARERVCGCVRESWGVRPVVERGVIEGGVREGCDRRGSKGGGVWECDRRGSLGVRDTASSSSSLLISSLSFL